MKKLIKPDGFSDWIADQPADLLIAYAEKWHLVQLLAKLKE